MEGPPPTAKDQSVKLYTKIFIGMACGIAAGLGLSWLGTGPGTTGAAVLAVLGPLGETFLRLLAMVIVPLVFASITLGIAALGGDLAKLGRVGLRTVAFFLLTTIVATFGGIALTRILEPGKGLDGATRARLAASQGEQAQALAGRQEAQKKRPSFGDILKNVVPKNPIAAMARGDMLQVIFFAFFLGVALALVDGTKRAPLVALLDGVNAAMVQCVHLVMKLAPIGVGALMTGVVARFGASVLLLLLRYMGVVVLGQFLILAFVDVGSASLLAGVRPMRFLRGIKESLLVAFSTSSSSAALPVTMACCEKNLGVSKQLTSFVTALGATINMNGTALYQGVSALFIAQVYGIPLDWTAGVSIVVTATLASVGTAGVPGSGLVTLVMVLRSIDVPVEGIALIMGVERILDMLRSAVNVAGDSTCAVVVAAAEGEFRHTNDPLEELV